MGKEAIEQVYHIENQQKFTKTIGTPAMEGRLINDLGFLGTSRACE